MSKPLRLALLQMHIEAGKPEANFSKLASMLEEAVSQTNKPDVIMFPEMWNTGYALTEIHEIADREGERTKAFLSAFSQKHQVHIIGGSIAELKGDKVLNTMYAFDRSGNVVSDYSKISSIPSYG